MYLPTYVPEGKTAGDIRADLTSSVKAAAPTYGVFSFGGPNMPQMLGMNNSAEAAAAVSPLNNTSNADERQATLLIRGTQDPLISNENVTAYIEALVKKGQRVEYVQVGEASHAFLDWKPNESTVQTFKKYREYYIKQMEHFFDSVLTE